MPRVRPQQRERSSDHISLVPAIVVAVLLLVTGGCATSTDGENSEGPIRLSAVLTEQEPPDEGAGDDAVATGEEATADQTDATAPLIVDPYDATGAAAAISQKVFPDGGAENVVLAREQPTGDALAAGALIGLFDTTLLLTDSEQLSPVTAAEIDRLGNPNVHILGGPDAISNDIETRLTNAGHQVHRHAGYLQAQTAVDVAARHFGEAETAVLITAPGRDAGVTDAISSALAATALAAAEDLPVLLTEADELSQATDAYLQGAVVEEVIVVGDEIDTSVTDRLEALGIEATTWAGGNRFETAVEVAQGRGFTTLDSAEVAILVEGGHDAVWPSGFLGAVLASRANGPVLLSDGTQLPPATARYLATGSADVSIVCTPGVTAEACATANASLDGG